MHGSNAAHDSDILSFEEIGYVFIHVAINAFEVVSVVHGFCTPSSGLVIFLSLNDFNTSVLTPALSNQRTTTAKG